MTLSEFLRYSRSSIDLFGVTRPSDPRLREDDTFARLIGVIRMDDEENPQPGSYPMNMTCHVMVMDFLEILRGTCCYAYPNHTITHFLKKRGFV